MSVRSKCLIWLRPRAHDRHRGTSEAPEHKGEDEEEIRTEMMHRFLSELFLTASAFSERYLGLPKPDPRAYAVSFLQPLGLQPCRDPHQFFGFSDGKLGSPSFPVPGQEVSDHPPDS